MPRVPLFVLAVALANFLVPLNSTMLVVALPAIARDLGVDEAAVAWLITLYLIAMAALQPIGGRIGDRLGPRRVVLVALVGFALASAAAPLARDLPALIGFRVLQALCACAITPNALGLLRGGATPGRTGTYFGVSGAMTGIGASAGPILGGIFASIDWRLIFTVNVPIVLVILALSWASLPRVPGRHTAAPDVAGALWLGATLTVAAWTLTQVRDSSAWLTAALLAAVAVSAVLFLRYEARHADAALPPRLFRSRPFSGANACIALSNVALYGTMLTIPFALGGPAMAVTSGLVIASMSVGNIVVAPIGGALVDRFGARVPVAMGGALIATGIVLPAAISFYPTLLFIAMPVAGAGIALTFPATRVAALESVPERFSGLAAGVTSTSRYFGGIVGALIAGAAVGGGPSAIPAAFVLFAVTGAASALVGAATLPPARPLLGRVDVAEGEPDDAVVHDLQRAGRDER